MPGLDCRAAVEAADGKGGRVNSVELTCERRIDELARRGRSLATRAERDQAAALLNRLLRARSTSSIAVLDAENSRGQRRAYGRPELRPRHVAAEAHSWQRAEHRHAAQRGFEILLRSNGARRAA